jgi:hypothetical protein
MNVTNERRLRKVVLQDDSEAGFPRAEMGQSVVDLGHGENLNLRSDFVANAKIEHIYRHGWAS